MNTLMFKRTAITITIAITIIIAIFVVYISKTPRVDKAGCHVVLSECLRCFAREHSVLPDEDRRLFKFLYGEHFLFDVINDKRKVNGIQSVVHECECCKNNSLQLYATFININAEIDNSLQRGEYTELATMLEHLFLHMESTEIYGTSSMLRKAGQIGDCLRSLEMIIDVEEKISTENLIKITECLKKIKLDVDYSLMTYLEFQRFNVSYPLLQIRPSYERVELDSLYAILNFLSTLDEFRKRKMEPSPEIITNDNVRLAHQHLMETLYTSINANTNNSNSIFDYSIVDYCRMEIAYVQYFYYFFTYSSNNIDQMIEQIHRAKAEMTIMGRTESNHSQ